MLKIYKYELACNNGVVQPLRLSTQHKFLSVQLQSGKICLWVLENTDTTITTIPIHTFGTGWPIETVVGLEYIGTVQEGRLVWHIFYGTNKEEA
jgi:hypothetical protein